MLDYAAFPQQRQALICQILQENGRVVCAELAARLQVSEHTIRRDLHELSREGFCKKVYGGAEQVDAIAQRAGAAGILISPPRTTGDGYYEAVIADPDGNLIEIVA